MRESFFCLKPGSVYDFPLLVTSQIMIPIIKTTINIPTHTPALKIPPTTAQLFRNMNMNTNNRVNNFFIF